MTGRVGHHGILLLGNGEVVRPPLTVLVMKNDQAPGTPASFVDPIGRTWTRGGAASVAADPGGMGGSCISIPNGTAGNVYTASHSSLEILTGDFTVEAFIRLPSSSPGGTYGTPLIGVPGASTTGWVLRANNGSLQWVYPGAVAYPHARAWVANQVVHVMACRQGSTHYVGVAGVATSHAGIGRTSGGTTVEVGQGSFNDGVGGVKLIAARIVKGAALYPGTSYVVPTGPL